MTLPFSRKSRLVHHQAVVYPWEFLNEFWWSDVFSDQPARIREETLNLATSSIRHSNKCTDNNKKSCLRMYHYVAFENAPIILRSLFSRLIMGWTAAYQWHRVDNQPFFQFSSSCFQEETQTSPFFWVPIPVFPHHSVITSHFAMSRHPQISLRSEISCRPILMCSSWAPLISQSSYIDEILVHV